MTSPSPLSPLGLQRLRVLDCLQSLNFPPRFTAEQLPDETAFATFRRVVAEHSTKRAATADPFIMSLLAAGRLLIGDLTGAEVIVDHLPAKAVKLDHGAGVCLVAPLYAMVTALPLPPDLQDTKRWVAGSAEQAALRAWLVAYRDKLVWHEADGAYRLVD
jgi:hypothetical protein